jgi:hypothetical protein
MSATGGRSGRRAYAAALDGIRLTEDSWFPAPSVREALERHTGMIRTIVITVDAEDGNDGPVR